MDQASFDPDKSMTLEDFALWLKEFFQESHIPFFNIEVSMKNLTDQQKGSLMAFVAVMFITPNSYLLDFQMLILGD